jgi:hypothetical protein
MAYLDAISDADAHYAAIGARDDAIEAAEQDVCDEIETAFTVLLTQHPAKTLAVPCASFSGGIILREKGVWLTEAITDTVQSGNVDAEMIAVLEKSTCPHVAALRLAMAKKWAYDNASEVAECRVDAA